LKGKSRDQIQETPFTSESPLFCESQRISDR